MRGKLRKMSEQIKILIAASSSIEGPAIKHWIGMLSDEWPVGTAYLEGNPALTRFLLEINASITPVSANSPLSYKKILSKFTHLVLLWDGEDLSRLLFEARISKIKTKVIPISVTKVVNKKTTNQYDIYIGRGSPWGNPFAIGHGDGPDRSEVIRRYKEYFEEKIVSDKSFKKGILSMRGMRLACFCKPEACHGDIIADYLNNINDENESNE